MYLYISGECSVWVFARRGHYILVSYILLSLISYISGMGTVCGCVWRDLYNLYPLYFILQERGLFGDVLGGILGGENATAAETATDAATDAAPSDIVNIQHCF